ncbi:MAG: transcription termination/antitermination protein NusA [Pelagibacteraceae bacterium]|nr:transcription termination/antitermination protein NusA [Pelagibacteraceae bacterium]
MLNRRADKLELLRIAEAVALEKSIDKELIIDSIESGIAKAAKSKFGSENDIKVLINRDNGDIGIFRKLTIVEKPENTNLEISLDEATVLNEENKSKKIGDEVLQPLPSFDFGRIAAQTAKQVISHNVREAERERQYNDFIDKKDTILSGIVKRLEFGNIIVDLGKAEGIIQKNEMIPRENIKAGDRVKAYCLDVRREPRGQQIFLSRAHPKFMEKLFIQEVPEIYDGLIEIKSSARDPGSRGKICVKAIDTSLDPVGACVGMRGSRVQAVVNELQGEKIDIVSWSDDPAVVVSNALSPAEIQRVNVDNEIKKLDVILTEENLSKAIGRRGQNVRLATKLLNYEINIMTDQEDTERRQIEFKEKTDNFIKNLELDETLGQLLVAEGFSSIDDIKDSSVEGLTKIEGIEEETAKELIERAKEFHQKDQEEISKKIKDLGLDNDLINHEGLTPGMLVTLGEQKILTLNDFADFASDELTGAYDIVKGERVKIKGCLEDFALSKKEADDLIMSARDKIYKN